MAKRRDRYGRYKGDGGIKAYKSNLPPMKAGKKRQKPAIRNMKAKPTKGGGWSKKQKLIAGAAVTGVAIGGGIVAQRALKEKALKKKHGDDYLPKTVTGYHYTYGNSQRKILKTQEFVSKQRFGLPGTKEGIWFTNDGSKKHRSSMTIQYGDNVVKAKFSRKAIVRNKTPFRDPKHKWLMVNRSDVQGKITAHHTEPLAASVLARAKRVANAKK